MYRMHIDPIFIDYAKTFNASMLSLWAVSQPFFLTWAEKQEPPIMQLDSRSTKLPSSIAIQPIVDIVKRNNLEDNRKGPFFTDLMQTFCIMFCVAAYDRLKEDDRYELISTQPVIQFFRHIRNSCAHGNKFYFKRYPDKKTGKMIEEPTKPAEFRGLTVERQLMNEDVNVFFDFMSAGDIPYLIEDVSRLLSKTS